MAQRVIDVADGNDTGLKRNLLAEEFIRVSASVPVLVVLECDYGSQTQHGMLARGQNGMAPERMLADSRPLVVVQ